MYEKHLAWGVLFRIFHWAFALSIVFLVVTGLYIHSPWTNSMIEGSRSFPMAEMRHVHFIAGYCFIGAILLRIYLWFFGNRQEKFWDSAPVTGRNIRNLFSTVTYYLYIKDEHEPRLGHNCLAGTVYIVTIVIAFFQILSGLYLLFPESTFWQGVGLSIFGTQQEARFYHFLTMWYFLIFVLIHLYILIWNDIRDPEGLISSIFCGKKFFEKGALDNK